MINPKAVVGVASETVGGHVIGGSLQALIICHHNVTMTLCPISLEMHVKLSIVTLTNNLQNNNALFMTLHADYLLSSQCYMNFTWIIILYIQHDVFYQEITLL